MKNGIPSHDTINRVFQSLNPRQFERFSWSEGPKEEGITERVTAVDGKTVRGSKDGFHHKSLLHSVHAWSVENGICLGQMRCGEKTNEITTIPQISDLSDITDDIITIDAMGTQRNIAEKTVADGVDYILSVKGNRGGSEEEVRTACKQNRPLFDVTAVEKGHGRIETRRCEVFAKGFTVDFGNRRKKLTSVIKITSVREFANKTETEERFYIGSLSADNDFNKYIRDHWAAENCLYRTSDMTFREDEQRKRADHAAKNFAVVRKIGLNPLKKDQGKESLRTKRLKAAWNIDYLSVRLKFKCVCPARVTTYLELSVSRIGRGNCKLDVSPFVGNKRTG